MIQVPGESGATGPAMAAQNEIQLYSQRVRLATLAVSDIEECIQEALRSTGDPYLVRGAIESVRIKSLERAEQKALHFGWTVADALSHIQDFVSFRVVCNNLQTLTARSTCLKSLCRPGLQVINWRPPGQVANMHWYSGITQRIDSL
jgi:hypothetical protein